MIDLNKMLEEDETYKSILNSLKEQERKYLEEYMKNFMLAWQNQFFSPLEEKINNDNEFRNEVKSKLESRDKLNGNS